MIRYRALHRPVADCKDASLAVQSDLRDTLIPEIMRRFAQTGDPNVLVVNNPESRVVDGDVPSLQDSSNLLTQIKERYNVEVSNGFIGSFERFVESLLKPEAREEGKNGTSLVGASCNVGSGKVPEVTSGKVSGNPVGDGSESGQSSGGTPEGVDAGE